VRSSAAALRAVPDTGGAMADATDCARLALRRVTSGVTVLTVRHGRHWHGATVSAVLAISRDPLVLGVALRTASRFTALTEKAGRFSVNVLGREQAALAAHFANPARPAGEAQFDGFGWTTDLTTGAPVIEGCLAHLACRVTGQHRVGDHDLILAEVIAGRHCQGEPLLSYSGRLCPELSIVTPEGADVS